MIGENESGGADGERLCRRMACAGKYEDGSVMRGDGGGFLVIVTLTPHLLCRSHVACVDLM